jgi:predicted nuclease of predicted toxin-antitoxin system
MALLYADENFSLRVVERLRDLGHDVVTVHERGRTGGDDAKVLSDATAEGRAVLTFDKRDFWRLHRLNSSHAGIIRCDMREVPDTLAANIHQAISLLPDLAGQFLRINRSP